MKASEYTISQTSQIFILLIGYRSIVSLYQLLGGLVKLKTKRHYLVVTF
jgi:hypothetical protein